MLPRLCGIVRQKKLQMLHHIDSIGFGEPPDYSFLFLMLRLCLHKYNLAVSFQFFSFSYFRKS